MLTGLSYSTSYFAVTDQCIDYIKSADNNTHIILIVSGLYASTVLADIHSYQSLKWVFVFCEDDDNYTSLFSQYNKIVEVHTEQESLRSAIVKKMDLIGRQTFQFTVIDERQQSMRDLTERTITLVVFILHSVLLNILKRMSPDDYAKEHFIDTCRKYYFHSKHDLIMIERFRATFIPEDSIQWYTSNCFLFRLLNRVLRTEDPEWLFAFRFYIILLCNALETEKQKLPPNTKLALFRGQKMSKMELNSLRKNIGSYITTNGFLSTSFDVDVALVFAGYGTSCEESLCIVLFEIQADVSVKSAVFAPIETESSFNSEREVLFSLNTIFKIKSIDFDDVFQVWKVIMITTDDRTKYMDEYLQLAATEERKLYTPLTYYGHVLWYEHQLVDKGVTYFQTLIKKLPVDHPDLSVVYNELGCAYHKKKMVLIIAIFDACS
ncbi:unnamed protein product [Rotaria sp. Silwood2]|nr:unnamed protein product [Rotaria sp. Silwood2]CAF3006441.1 unnamed protein product [Rotaria sp. Silwood2]CAF3269746.1 unnamed protein product [Rotaria sp. Silwood2]CAF3356691.1 unnamed protein product [Rotaria sp. Silwood2]CAF4064155.1 unnamed protein product [Rotaria sp. Silwood2]